MATASSSSDQTDGIIVRLIEVGLVWFIQFFEGPFLDQGVFSDKSHGGWRGVCL